MLVSSSINLAISLEMAAIDRGGGDFAGAGVAAKREKEDYEGRKGGGVGRTNKSISDKLNQQKGGKFSSGLWFWSGL